LQLQPKKIFNQDSGEDFLHSRVIGGNPTGIINFNQTNHNWATDLFEKMEARTWFTTQVSLAIDKVNYPKLSDADRRMYKLVLAQLISNDSIQTNQLMDGINRYITSPAVNACLAMQAKEEAVHSKSYAVMAETILQDDQQEVYTLHMLDDELSRKNDAVAAMYDNLYTGNDPSKEDLLMVFVANQVLEELVFPGGFVAMHMLEHVMPGSSAMISEIQKDETLSHVELFKNIFRTTIAEEFGGTVPDSVRIMAHKLIRDMTEAEIRWTLYATEGVIGFTEKAITICVEEQANSVCRNLMLPMLYEKRKDNPLRKILIDHLKDGNTSSRTSFFEKNVVEYSKNSLEIDF